MYYEKSFILVDKESDAKIPLNFSFISESLDTSWHKVAVSIYSFIHAFIHLKFNIFMYACKYNLINFVFCIRKQFNVFKTLQNINRCVQYLFYPTILHKR